MNPDPHSSHYAYKLEGRIEALESKVELLICELKALRKQQSCTGLASPKDYWLVARKDCPTMPYTVWLSEPKPEPNLEIIHVRPVDCATAVTAITSMI